MFIDSRPPHHPLRSKERRTTRLFTAQASLRSFERSRRFFWCRDLLTSHPSGVKRIAHDLAKQLKQSKGLRAFVKEFLRH